MKTPSSNLSHSARLIDRFAGWNVCKFSLLLLFCFLCLRLSAAESARVTLVRTPDDGIQPQAAVDSQKIVHLIYYKGEAGSGDIFYVRQEPGQAASEMVNRNETLLISRNRGADFEIAYQHGWKVATCPMSSAFLSETKAGVLAAAETHGRVYFVRVDPKTGKVSEPVSPTGKRKHPVAVGNAEGEVLLAGTEGTAWGKGGAVGWQVYDQAGNPTSEKGQADGVPVWSLVTAFAKPDGSFVIVY